MTTGRPTRRWTGRTAHLLLAALFAGCHTWRVETAPPQQAILEGKKSAVRITRPDSSVVVLHTPYIARDTVWGLATSGGAAGKRPGTRLNEEFRREVPLAEVQQIETQKVDAVATGFAVLGGGLLVLLLAFAISDPLGDWSWRQQ